MTALVEALRLLIAATIQFGVAFRAGFRTAQDRQKQTDRDQADEAIKARDGAATGDRDAILGELSDQGKLRD